MTEIMIIPPLHYLDNPFNFRAVFENKKIFFNFKVLLENISESEELVNWLKNGNKPDNYTGLLDIDNTLIYENDIISYKPIRHAKNMKKHMISKVSFNLGMYNVQGFHRGSLLNIFEEIVDYKVIGNFHQNKDLIGY